MPDSAAGHRRRPQCGGAIGPASAPRRQPTCACRRLCPSARTGAPADLSPLPLHRAPPSPAAAVVFRARPLPPPPRYVVSFAFPGPFLPASRVARGGACPPAPGSLHTAASDRGPLTLAPASGTLSRSGVARRTVTHGLLGERQLLAQGCVGVLGASGTGFSCLTPPTSYPGDEALRVTSVLHGFFQTGGHSGSPHPPGWGPGGSAAARCGTRRASMSGSSAA